MRTITIELQSTYILIGMDSESVQQRSNAASKTQKQNLQFNPLKLVKLFLVVYWKWNVSKYLFRYFIAKY